MNIETAYGVLGLSLIFVGIVLVMNGVGTLCKFDSKSMAIMNIITGVLLVIVNFIKLGNVINNLNASLIDYQSVASGFLFGFTYVFIAANHLFKLDPRPFGWFSFFVTIFAVIFSVRAFIDKDLIFGFLWAAWAILWLEGFLELVAKLKIGKIFPYLSILEGVFAAFIPGILMLLDVIKLG